MRGLTRAGCRVWDVLPKTCIYRLFRTFIGAPKSLADLKELCELRHFTLQNAHSLGGGISGVSSHVGWRLPVPSNNTNKNKNTLVCSIFLP